MTIAVNGKNGINLRALAYRDEEPRSMTEDPSGAFEALMDLAATKGNARIWLDRHREGKVSPALAAAQEALDRAVEGGFFDEWDGRPLGDESEVAVRREIQEAAGALLDDPTVEVWLTEENYHERGQRRWRTRLLAVPRAR